LEAEPTKKMILWGLFILIGWTSFYDVTTGTLSFIDGSKPAIIHAETIEHNQPAIPNEPVTIKPGDTVLSVHEQINPKAKISIQKVIEDFRKLNKGTNPNHIQMGQSYRFPTY